MPGRERRSFTLLGRGGLGNAFSESCAANLRVPCEELRHSQRNTFAENGTWLAKAGDAIRGYSIRRFEYEPLCRAIDPCRLSAALLPGDGDKDCAAGSRGRKRISRTRCDER